MARRGLGGGMTALRAALGAVTGVAEGLQQREALQRKQKLDEENAAFSRAGMLKSLGFTPRAVRDTADPAAMDVVSLDTPALAPRGASQAFASAMQQGMGVDPTQRRLGAMDTQSTAKPLTAALGSAEAKLKDFERQRSSLQANPNMQMNLPGVGRIGFDPEETEEEKKSKALTQALSALTPEQRAQYEPLVRANFAGVPSNVLQAITTPREPRPSRTQLNEKTGQIVNLDTGETTKAQGYILPPEDKKADKPRFGEVASLRKEFNTEARPYKTINDALQIIERLGTKENPTPQDVQALIYAFVKVQDPTSVVRESEYANAANAIALADKLGSLQELYIQGKRLSQTQRKDMVETARVLREEAMSRYGALADSYESTATSFGMKPELVVPNRLDRTGKESGGKKTPDEWLDANPQGKNESDAAYKARYKAATGGR